MICDMESWRQAIIKDWILIYHCHVLLVPVLLYTYYVLYNWKYLLIFCLNPIFKCGLNNLERQTRVKVINLRCKEFCKAYHSFWKWNIKKWIELHGWFWICVNESPVYVFSKTCPKLYMKNSTWLWCTKVVLVSTISVILFI